MACQTVPNIVASILTFMFIQFGSNPLVNDEYWSESIGLKMTYTIALFVVLTLISMVVNYIAQLKGKMNKLIVENLNLLDKMHEGLIVISESDQSL